jgi:hypothetical protein
MLRSALATTAVAALLAAAGCGSSGSSNGAPASKARFIARADAICKPLNARRSAANTEVGPVTSTATLPKVAQIAPFLAAFERNAVVELRRLTAPAALAGSWRRILAGTQLLAEDSVRLGEQAKAGDLKAVKDTIHRSQQRERELIAIAAPAGFAHCGRNT